MPSTTVTSLASLGTGLVPGQHGMVGYTSRVPVDRGDPERADLGVGPGARAYQAKPTFFERAAAAGVAVSSVALQRFAGTGLTEAALRGRGASWPTTTTDAAERTDRADGGRVPAGRAEPRLRATSGSSTTAGTRTAAQSAEWRRRAGRRWTRRCQTLRDALPDDVRLVITADHGMLDIPTGHRLVAEDEPELMAGVTALAGRAAVPPALRRP